LEINGEGDPLNNVKLPDTELGKAHYIRVIDPNTGIETPIFTVVTPSPATITILGANINDEVVVDFKPAVGSTNVQSYEIRYWPADDPSNYKSQVVSPKNVTGNIIRDLNPDTTYKVQVYTTFVDGDVIPSAVASILTPPEGKTC
jgi:hypothetical protein